LNFIPRKKYLLISLILFVILSNLICAEDIQRAREYYKAGMEFLKSDGISLALNCFKKVKAEYEKTGIKDKSYAELLILIASLQTKLMQIEDALNNYKEAFAISRKIGNEEMQNDCLLMLGNISILYMDSENAFKYLKEAEKLCRRMDKLEDLSSVLKILSTLYMMRGENKKSEAALKEYNEIEKRLKAEKEKSQNFELGEKYYSQNKLDEALKYFLKYFNTCNKKKIDDKYIKTLLNIGIIYQNFNIYEKAIYFLEKARDILKDVQGEDFRFLRIIALNSLTSVYISLGEYKRAVEKLNEALSIQKTSDEKAICLLNMSVIYMLSEKYTDALDCLKKVREIKPDDDSDISAQIWSFTGLHYHRMEMYKEAAHFYKKALRVMRKNPNLRMVFYIVLGGLGETYIKMGKENKGLKYLKQAIEGFRRFGMKSSEANGWALTANVYENKGQYEKAEECYLNAIDIIEKIRSEIKTPERRIVYFSKNVDVYKKYGFFLETQKRYEESFVYSEMSKARVFRDMLKGAWNISKVPEKLLGTERDLRFQVSGCEAKLVELKADENASAKKVIEAEQNLKEKIDEYDRVKREMVEYLPEYSEKIDISVKDIEEHLDKSVVFIEYMVGDQGTLIYAVEKGKGLRVNWIDIKQSELYKKVKDFVSLFGTGNKNKLADLQTVKRKSRQLYQLLIKPVEDLLAEATGVVISPDDVLWRLPFEALFDGKQYLVQKNYWISYIPSGSVMLSEPKTVKKRRNSILAFAPFAPQRSQDVVWIKRESSLIALQDMELSKLEFSEVECREIVKLFKRGTVYTGKNAREYYVKKLPYKVDVLHFSTHGFADEENPLGSFIVLAAGKGEDGYLTAREVLGMDMNGVELVSLGACSTGLGQEISGEGMLGLTRSFMLSGAQRVLSSLWNVAHKSTAKLMTDFYRLWLVEGKPAPVAFKEAKLRLRKSGIEVGLSSEDSIHPFFWAPFVIYGNYR